MCGAGHHCASPAPTGVVHRLGQQGPAAGDCCLAALAFHHGWALPRRPACVCQVLGHCDSNTEVGTAQLAGFGSSVAATARSPARTAGHGFAEPARHHRSGAACGGLGEAHHTTDAPLLCRRRTAPPAPLQPVCYLRLVTQTRSVSTLCALHGYMQGGERTGWGVGGVNGEKERSRNPNTPVPRTLPVPAVPLRLPPKHAYACMHGAPPARATEVHVSAVREEGRKGGGGGRGE